MERLTARLRHFSPVLWAGSAAWALGVAPPAWSTGRPALWALAAAAWFVLLAAGVVASPRWALGLGLYGFLALSAAVLLFGRQPSGGPFSRAVLLLAWVAYALSWGALTARDLPLLDEGERAPRPPRRSASRWALLVPLLAVGLGFALLVPLGPELGPLEQRPEVLLLVELLGVVLAVALVGRAATWGVAQHFPPPITARDRLLGALGPLVVLVLLGALGAWWLG